MSTAKGKTPRDVVKKPSTPAKPKADKPKADKPAVDDPSSAETLIGSSKFEATYKIGGETVQLGTLVLEAHKRSGVSLEEWNKLPDADRDSWIGEVLEGMQAAATAPAIVVGPGSPGWKSSPALDAIEALLASFDLSIDWESAPLGILDRLEAVEPKSLVTFFDPDHSPNTPGEHNKGGSGDIGAAPAGTAPANGFELSPRADGNAAHPVDVVDFAVREGALIATQVDNMLNAGNGAGALALIDSRLADFKAARPAIDAIERVLREKRIAIGGDRAVEPRVTCWTVELVRWAGKEQPIGARLELPQSIFDKLLADRAVTDKDPNAPKPADAEDAPAQ